MSRQGAISRAGALKAFWAGAIAAAGVLTLVAGALLRLVPNGTPLSAIARMFDSLSPWFLMVALAAGLAVVLLQHRWAGGVLAVLAFAALSHLWIDHHRVSLPVLPQEDADMRVVFFNMYAGNAAYADRVITAVIEADPDVVVIAEGEGLYPALSRLQQAYVFVTPCAFEDCELIIAAKRAPKRHWFLSLNVAWQDRYGVAELTSDSGKTYFLAASHSAKPWLTGIAESEQIRLAAQYDWLNGPVVAVGDFNAAPWGYSLRHVLDRTGMRAARWPVATWPAGAGRFGVPIDHVLVKGGARIVDMRPFGQELNSNHLGLVADITLP